MSSCLRFVLIWFSTYLSTAALTVLTRNQSGIHHTGIRNVDVAVPKRVSKSYVQAAATPLPNASERKYDNRQPSSALDRLGSWAKLVASFLKSAQAKNRDSSSDENLFAKCRKLTQNQPGLGNLAVIDGTFKFRSEPLEPVHIFYRFSGRSRHDRGEQNTPALGAVSLLGALSATSDVLRRSVNVHILLNSDTGARHQGWFEEQLSALELESFNVTEVPAGNDESYNKMLDIARAVEDSPRALMFFLEEDYLCHPDMLTKLVEFWSAYNPCVAVPYDYPDRYTRTDNQGYGAETILHAPGLHWRTVESATVTFATRLDVFHALDRKTLLPAPWGDRGPARRINHLLGLWGPMPSLASHMHNDCKGDCILSDPDFDYPAFQAELLAEANHLGYNFTV